MRLIYSALGDPMQYFAKEDVEKAVAKEREACAEIADRIHARSLKIANRAGLPWDEQQKAWDRFGCSGEIADAIRARSEQKSPSP